jgi:predicted DNA-binding antitoxin AbrB/MazE fold protein
MAELIDAVYEQGMFRPLEPVELPEGQRVTVSVEPGALAPEEAEEQLRAWRTVYEGLSESDISEVEAMALDRGHFSPSGRAGPPSPAAPSGLKRSLSTPPGGG